MNIKCKNCNQFIDDSDTFCKYCGCPLEKPKEKEAKEERLTAKQIDDRLQEAKTIITDGDIETSAQWAYENLKIKLKGSKNSLVMKNSLLSCAFFLLIIIGFVGAFMLKDTLWIPSFVRVICMLVCLFGILTLFVLILEKYFTITSFYNLKENKIILRKYGFKKPAEFLIDNKIFEVQPLKACLLCKGELVGDLHIEKIAGRLVVVCNMDRKHIWYIAEAEFFSKLKGEQYEKEKGQHTNGDKKEI